MPAKGQKRKQQIMDVAKEMFIKNGFQSTHIGQVCDTLEIARGTVYQYFGNKREILYAVLESVEEKFDDIFDVDDLDFFLEGKPGKELMHEFVSNRIASCIKAILSEPIVIKLMYKEIFGIDEDVVNHVNNFVAYINRILVRDFKVFKEKGFYKSDISEEVSAGMLIGGVLLLLHEYEVRGENILNREIIDSIAKNFLFGVVSS
ncbi:MAG TPA: TetR/AcrR family transcriptional regulator [Spirochaetota bacterium]|nr:TetR/AcrR family transcriptional regulator [Spirochaetota bacterium]